MALSDDELNERIHRTLADADVKLGMMLAHVTATGEKAAAAFTEFGQVCADLTTATLDAMTPDQRSACTTLVSLGIPFFDAAVEAEELFPQHQQ